MIKENRKISLIAGIILAILGFGFLVAAFCINLYDSNARNNWIEETAIITEIYEDKEMIKISYIYKDELYVIEPSYYSSEFSLGDTLIIFINPNKLNDIYISDTKELFIAFYCVGGFFGLIGLALIIVYNINEKKIKECLENGSKKTLQVIELIKTHCYKSYQVYYSFKVNYKDKDYRSGIFLLPKEFDINELGVVDMYILENGKYYIDVTSYRKGEILEF